MKIVFMGTPAFSVPTLTFLLHSKHTIAAVITQPDRPKGRGGKLQQSPVKTLALSRGAPVFQPEKINTDGECINMLKKISPDIIIVVAYGQILSEEILILPYHGCINLHASLLPKYRGAAPINWAIIQKEQVSGVTVMQMDAGMDTGDMLYRKTVPVAPSDTAIELHDALSEIGAQAVSTTLENIEQGIVVPEAQDNSQATYAPRLKKEDGLIDWGEDAESIVSRIKGVLPWPCAYTYCKGKMIKLWNAEVAAGVTGKKPGIVTVLNKNALEVAARDGKAVRITEIQMQSRLKMKTQQFIQGNFLATGDMFMNKECQ